MILCALFLFIANYPVIGTAEVTIDDVKKLGEANNNLLQSLWPRITDGNSDNLFFGPLSLLTSLGIILAGTRGNTQKELYLTLGYKEAGLPMNKIPQTVNYYLTKLLPQNDASVSNFSLFAADEVLVTNQAPLNPKFQKEQQQLYLSPIKNVNFSDSKGVVKDINNFVKNGTHGKIKSIVNSLNTTPYSILVDTVFFQGKWETPFPPKFTMRRPFYTPNGARNVSFMQVVDTFPFLENRDYQAVMLPYKGKNIGLLVLVPRLTYGLSSLETDLTPKRIVNILHLLQPQRTHVLLPRFSFTYYREMSNDIIALGAKRVYDGSGDFSGMTDSDCLSVSYTFVKSAIQVNEANQGAGMKVDFTPPIPSTVLAERPFMFAVVDKRINMLVFLGRILQ